MGAEWIQQEQCLEQEWHEVRDRILENVRKDSAHGCWLWRGCVDSLGYGVLRIGSNQECAHIAAYRHFNGDIPSGMCVCHRCDSPACVNPSHLFLCTHN